MSKISEIVDYYSLRPYFKALFYSRGAANPYHNIRHTLDVMIRCDAALNYYELFSRELMIASLFHDFDHTGRAGNDDLNIELAVRGMRKHAAGFETDNSLNQIESIIRSTEYGPGGHLKENNCQYCRILQDADLAQAFSPAWIRIVLFGLSEELNITPVQMANLQIDFLSKLEFKTTWAELNFDSLIPEKIQETKDLLSLLE